MLKKYGQDEYIGLDQGALKTSSRRLLKTKMKDIFKTSSSIQMFAGNVQVCFRLGVEPMGHMKLLLSKSGSLIRGVVGGVMAGLGGVCRLELLGQSRDLRQMLQLEWVIVSEKRDVFVFEARFVGIRHLALLKFLQCVFPGKLP